MNAFDGHGYSVHRNARDGYVSFLRCQFCPMSLDPRSFRRSGDCSGQARYNRCRSAMVKHLHEKHRAALQALGDARGAPR